MTIAEEIKSYIGSASMTDEEYLAHYGMVSLYLTMRFSVPAVNGVFYKRACSSIVSWQATQYRQCSCLNIRMTMPPYMIASRASRDCLTHSVLCLGSMRYMAVLQT